MFTNPITQAPIRCLWSTLLVVLALTSCTTSSSTAKKEAKPTDATFQARAALTVEQQRNFDKVYLEAICQKLKGNTDSAYELLEYALEINPKASEVLYELANMQLASIPQTNFLTQNDSIMKLRGEHMLKRAYELEPSNPYFRNTLAEHYIRSGSYDKAAPLYELMAEEKPTEQNITILSRLYEGMLESDKAISALERLEQYQGYTEETAVEKYSIYLQDGKYDLATKAIERLVEEDPAELRYRVMLGDVFMQFDRDEEALQLYNAVLEADPNYSMAHQSMLRHYLNSGQRKQFHQSFSKLMLTPDMSFMEKRALLQSYAVQCVQEPELIDRDSIFSHFCEALSTPQEDGSIAELCLAFMEVAEINEDASTLPFETAIAFDPTNLMATYKLVQNYVSQGDFAKLAQLCQTSAQHNPDDIILAYYEGAALIHLDRLDEAIKAYERGANAINEETDADIASDLYASLGDVYHERRLIEKAFKAYDSSLIYNAENIGCLNNYAYFLCLEGGNLDKALSMSKKTVEAEPNNSTYLDTYAWALYCKKQYTQAKIYIDKTFENLSEEELNAASSASLYDHAGDIYFRCGEQKKACDFWTRARELTRDNDLVKKLNVKIKNRKI